MRVDLHNGNDIFSGDFVIPEFGILCNIIEKGFLDKYGSEEKVKEEFLRLHRLYFPFLIDESKTNNYREVAHNFLFRLQHHMSHVFYTTASVIANEYGSNFPKVLVYLINNMNFDREERPLSAVMRFDNESSRYFLKELNIAFMKGFIDGKEKPSLAETLNHVLGGKLKKEKSKLLEFCEKMIPKLDSKEEIEIFIEDSDLYLDYKYYISRFGNLPYKKIVKSKEFMDYIEDCDDEDVGRSLNTILDEFLESEEFKASEYTFDVQNEFCNLIRNDPEKFKKHVVDLNRMKNTRYVTFENKEIDLFMLINKELTDEESRRLIYRKNY